uniref:Uncharacterized protein n=1 Tax=Anopheles melas TaxID=34690 RepID=A0A182TGV9_9DIPT
MNQNRRFALALKMSRVLLLRSNCRVAWVSVHTMRCQYLLVLTVVLCALTVNSLKPDLPKAKDPLFNKMLAESSTKGSVAINKVKINEDIDSYEEVLLKGNGKSVKPSKSTTAKPVAKPATEDNYDEYDDDESDEQIDFSGVDKVLAQPLNAEDYYDDDEYDDDDNAEPSNSSYCPRGCICERNMHAYMVATCSRLDLETQKFTSHITDLQVLDVGPKYPIELGPEFFKKIGLSHVVSIKITNCTIVYISPQAFAGLDELYSVNLTNSGIDIIHPDTFANNTKLRLLTLSGNDLSAMQSVNHNTPYMDYMLKAPTVEELDISRCKLQELQPNAFNELKNIIYINLSENNLSNLPEGIFDNVETIEELDLSMNNIVELPRNIFAKTSLAILHLKHNKITNNVDFVTADLQKLDLSFCQIRTVHNTMFKGMDGLTNLILKGNHIEKIKPMAFISLKNLRQIDLSYNNLEQISAQTFIGNKMLDIIRLNNNPRLKRLPNEGFEISFNGTFTVYFMDVSNCDISELADNTFKTMPHLTRLNLAWNNLQTIRSAYFAHLNKLMDLDLSNNMIINMDEKTFQNNRNLNTLNLAGNQIATLTSKLFHPLQYLSELDVSDCDLRTIWDDSAAGTKREEVLPNLKRLNVSYNEIMEVFVSDLESMGKLRVLDIRNNTLTCNERLPTLIDWLQKKQISMGLGDTHDHVTHAEMTTELRTDNSATLKQWGQFAWEICQGGGSDSPNQRLTYSESDEEYNIEDEDDKIEQGILTGKQADEDDDGEYEDDGASVDDVVILENGSMFAVSSVWIVVACILFGISMLLLVVVKVLTEVMKRRGERYRQALLASKNSFVYQKLTEDIVPSKVPKIHRYEPINQV